MDKQMYGLTDRQEEVESEVIFLFIQGIATCVDSERLRIEVIHQLTTK